MITVSIMTPAMILLLMRNMSYAGQVDYPEGEGCPLNTKIMQWINNSHGRAT